MAYAEVCKTFYVGSIPAPASISYKINILIENIDLKIRIKENETKFIFLIVSLISFIPFIIMYLIDYVKQENDCEKLQTKAFFKRI